MWRADSLEKALMLGKIEGRRRGWQRMRWLKRITYSMDMSLSKFQEIVEDRVREIVEDQHTSWCAAVHDVPKSWIWLSNWTTTVITTVAPSRRWEMLQYTVWETGIWKQTDLGSRKIQVLRSYVIIFNLDLSVLWKHFHQDFLGRQKHVIMGKKTLEKMYHQFWNQLPIAV